MGNYYDNKFWRNSSVVKSSRVNSNFTGVFLAHPVLLHTHTLSSWLQFLEIGIIFCVILLFIRGEPLSKFSLKCIFCPPLSNEGSDRCSGVFVFEIFGFKVFWFYSWTLSFFFTFWSFITRNHNSNLSDHYQHSYLVKRLAFVVCLLY